MSELTPQIQTPDTVIPGPPVSPEYGRFSGERGAINFGRAIDVVNGMRRAILDRRIERLDASIDEHYVEADYADALRQHIGEQMGEQYDAAGHLVAPHQPAAPKPHTHPTHVESRYPFSSDVTDRDGVSWSPRDRIARLRAEAAADLVPDLDGTKLAPPEPGGKPAIAGISGRAIEREVDPPTRWARKLERETARRLRLHTDESRYQSSQEGRLGTHRRAPWRSRMARVRGWLNDISNPDVSAFEAMDNSHARRGESVHVPTRRVKRTAARVNELRGGTLRGLGQAGDVREALARKKEAKIAKLEAKRARL